MDVRRVAIGLLMAFFVSITAPLPNQNGWAQSFSGTPMVSGSIIRDFARITFYWSERVGFNARTDGNRLIVEFDRPVNPDFGTILRSLYPYVTSSELSGDRRKIIFKMKQPYEIRTFITNSETGVDLMGINEEATTAIASATTAAPAKPKTETKPRFTPPPPHVKPAAPAKPAPVAKTPEPLSDPTLTPAPTPDKEAPVQSVPVEEVKTAELELPKEVRQAMKDKFATPSSASQAQETSAAIAAPEYGEKKSITGDDMSIELTRVADMPTLFFPWKERVASAVWIRGETVWILFNKPVTLANLDDIIGNSTAWMVGAEQMGGEDFTLLRIRTKTQLFAITRKEPQGYGWKVSVTATPSFPEDTIVAEFNTEVSEPYAFFSVTQVDGPYTIQDPVLGDYVTVLPLYEAGKGYHPGRGFVEFALMESAQGIAILPFADTVDIRRLRNGVRISAPDGLIISTSLPPIENEEGGVDEEGKIRGSEKFRPTLFPYAEWIPKEGMSFTEMEGFLLNEAIRDPSEYRQNQRRMELAKLYLSEALQVEALTVLSRIRAIDPDFYREHKLIALEGAAYLLNDRFSEAGVSFSSSVLDGEPEAPLLRKTVAATLDGKAEAIPFMEYNDSYIRQYPPKFRQRMAIIATNHFIRNRDFIAAMKVLNTLEQDNQTESIAEYVTFLRAKVAAEVGRIDDAKRMWGELASNIEDRQFRARAEYALTLLQLNEAEITPAEAIERLERLRIVWRGDDLERSLLTLLGQLYVNNNNYWDGMKAWEELLQFYPNTQDAIASYKRLSETFRYLFLEGGADDMRPLEALALYNEFQELTPLGDDGNKMIQNLVDTLVKVDLLEQAAARLESQVQYRLDGEEKSLIGARLALIHLLNREPTKALFALRDSRVNGVPGSLSLERNRLAAQGLLDLDRPDQALSMITGDYSPEGEAVRLEAYWAKEDWANVIDIIELMFQNREDPNAPFNPLEGQHLIQLTLAYLFLGEYNQLGYLRDAYAPLMKGHPYENEFLFIAQDRIQLDHQNFQKVVDSIADMEGFMGNFRQELQESTLSATIEAPDASEAPAAPDLEKAIPDDATQEATPEETDEMEEVE